MTTRPFVFRCLISLRRRFPLVFSLCLSLVFAVFSTAAELRGDTGGTCAGTNVGWQGMHTHARAIDRSCFRRRRRFERGTHFEISNVSFAPFSFLGDVDRRFSQLISMVVLVSSYSSSSHPVKSTVHSNDCNPRPITTKIQKDMFKV